MTTPTDPPKPSFEQWCAAQGLDPATTERWAECDKHPPATPKPHRPSCQCGTCAKWGLAAARAELAALRNRDRSLEDQLCRIAAVVGDASTVMEGDMTVATACLNYIAALRTRLEAAEAENERLRFAIEYAVQMVADRERIQKYLRAALAPQKEASE